MEYVNFVGGQERLSKIVLGLMRIDRKSTMELGELLFAALEGGVNMLDIADIYGGGKCESLLGELFRVTPGLRDKFYLQSKCSINKSGRSFDGKRQTYYDFSKAYILSSVDGILRRLQTDHLDSLLLHRPDVLMEPDEVAEAFTVLKQQGKVFSFGVSNQNAAQMELLRQTLPFPLVCNQLQLSCAHTLMIDSGVNVNLRNDFGIVREGGVLEYCRLHGIAVQAWSSLQYGWFEGCFVGSDKFPRLNAALDFYAGKYSAECGRLVTPSAVALAWILRIPGRTQAVVGTGNPQHLLEACAASDFQLSREEWYDIYLASGHQLP